MNALFLAREKAIENDDQEDAADLRRELSKLGITVRDDGKDNIGVSTGRSHNRIATIRADWSDKRMIPDGD